jgi:hypothetical protein
MWSVVWARDSTSPAATVVSRKSTGGGKALYNVSYAIGRRRENDLPTDLLSAHTETVGRRSSSSSSAADATSSDARRAAELKQGFHDKMKEKERQMNVKRWQAHQNRQEAMGFMKKMNGAMKKLSLLAACMKAAAEEGITAKLEQQACPKELPPTGEHRVAVPPRVLPTHHGDGPH